MAYVDSDAVLTARLPKYSDAAFSSHDRDYLNTVTLIAPIPVDLARPHLSVHVTEPLPHYLILT